MSRLAFLLSVAPDDGAIAFEACSIIHQTLEAGHSVVVFLYEDGVHFASSQRDIPQGEIDPAMQFMALASHKKCSILACITASERRGLSKDLLANGIKFGGLGEWTEAIIEADSVVQLR